MVYPVPQLFLLAYPHTNVGLPAVPATTLQSVLSTPPPVWMNVSSLTLGCWTSTQFVFLAILVVFVFKLVVILLLVVRGSKAYLPTSPFWLEVPEYF